MLNDWKNYPGLYAKFLVFRTDRWTVVDDCFVLRPTVDASARLALLVYASSIEIDNPLLAEELRLWIKGIEMGSQEKPAWEGESDDVDPDN